MDRPTQVASVFAAIGADLSGLNSGLRESREKLGGFQGFMQKTGQSVSKVGRSMALGVTMPLIGMGAMMVKEAANFEAATNILDIAARQSGTGLQELRTAALAVGKDTQLVGIDAMEAAEAMTNFYKAGLSTADVFIDLNRYLEEGTNLTGAMRAAIDLAAASDLNLAQASEAVAIAMATYNLEASEATKIADTFVGAADASIAEVSGLVDAMSAVGPTMSAFGISLEDTNVALAILSERGIQGSEAGTALKSMFTNMMRPTDAVKEALADLNVQLYDQEGRLRDFPALMADFETALFGTGTALRHIGGPTKEQTQIIKRYQGQIDGAKRAIEEYQEGARGASLTEKRRSDRLAELEAKIGLYTRKIEDLNIEEARTVQIMRTLTEEQRNQYIQTLAGTYGMKAMQTLLAEGQAGWDGMAQSVGDAATAQEVGAKRTEGLQGKLESLQGAVQTFMIEAGGPFLEEFATPAVEELTGVVSALGDLDPAVLSTGIKFGLALAAVGPFLIVVGKLIPVLSLLATPLGASVALIGAVAGVLFLGSDAGDDFRSSLRLLGEELSKDEATSGVGRLIIKLSGLLDKLAEIGKFLDELFAPRLGTDLERTPWRRLGEDIFGGAREESLEKYYERHPEERPPVPTLLPMKLKDWHTTGWEAINAFVGGAQDLLGPPVTGVYGMGDAAIVVPVGVSSQTDQIRTEGYAAGEDYGNAFLSGFDSIVAGPEGQRILAAARARGTR